MGLCFFLRVVLVLHDGLILVLIFSQSGRMTLLDVLRCLQGKTTEQKLSSALQCTTLHLGEFHVPRYPRLLASSRMLSIKCEGVSTFSTEYAFYVWCNSTRTAFQTQKTFFFSIISFTPLTDSSTA